MIILDICLSDIPKERITAAKNGKKYCRMIVTEMRQPDNYGNSHTVYMGQSKEEREAKQPKVYVGKGTCYSGSDAPRKAAPRAKMPIEGENDLPF